MGSNGLQHDTLFLMFAGTRVPGTLNRGLRTSSGWVPMGPDGSRQDPFYDGCVGTQVEAVRRVPRGFEMDCENGGTGKFPKELLANRARVEDNQADVSGPVPSHKSVAKFLCKGSIPFACGALLAYVQCSRRCHSKDLIAASRGAWFAVLASIAP